jgi:hypothetical protein
MQVMVRGVWFCSDQSPMVKPKYIGGIHGICVPVYTGVEYLSKSMIWR